MIQIPDSSVVYRFFVLNGKHSSEGVYPIIYIHIIQIADSSVVYIADFPYLMENILQGVFIHIIHISDSSILYRTNSSTS